MSHPTQQPVYYPATMTRPTSGLAIAGFICSLLWGFGILSLIGLTLSIAGIRETQRGGKRGFGLAVAGTVIGALGVIGLAVFIGTGIQTWTT